MKRIALLGSTGVVGRNTLDVVRHLSNEFSIGSLAANTNIDLLEKQIHEFHPKIVAVYDRDKARELQKNVPDCLIVSGMEGLCAAAIECDANLVVLAMSGMKGLTPALAAIDANLTIALANKEILVSAGELFMNRLAKTSKPLIPIDSEHSAIFQCLQGRPSTHLRRLILTASGGPFLHYSQSELESVTLALALNHPKWKMGAKITIDSSNLMNKGLELIEAHFLFHCPLSQMEVVVHPESIIHSMVEFIDGSILAQMSEPNMVFPIQYALTYPDRKNGMMPNFDFSKMREMHFLPPDEEKFIALSIAKEALLRKKSYLPFMNAANEVLVERFLKEEIRWIEIGQKLEKLMSSHQPVDVLTLDAILAVDEDARRKARHW